MITRTLINKSKKLLRLSSEYESNKDIDLTISSFKPPIFWKDKEIIKQQIKLLNFEKIKDLLQKTSEIELIIKKNPGISINLTTDFIISQTN